MSGNLPWYKRDVDAWRGGTRGMSLELRGFYSELLDAMWDSQKPLKNDDAHLAMMCCCNKRTVRKLLPQLIALGKIVVTPEGLINARMSKEIAEANARNSGVVSAPVPAPVSDAVLGPVSGPVSRSGFRPLAANSTRIRPEFELKNPKKPMNSTRALEEEEELRKRRRQLILEKQEQARAYEASLEQMATGGLAQ